MKKSIKLAIMLTSGFLSLLILSGLIFFFIPAPSDFGTFKEMRNLQINMMEKYNNREKEINGYFKDYQLSLPPLYAYMFKSRNLSLFLKSYSGERVDTATINQLEIGTETDNFFDFTFMIRPRSEYNVPFFHGDALKALPGVTGALYMDFYSLNDNIDADTFFGDRIEKIKKAMDLAEPYWKHDGFGELTPHLDPFKSSWRLEMVEPEKGDEVEIKEYYNTVYKCFQLYLEAYMESLELAEKSDYQSEIEGFVSILYEEDIAVKMGKMIFPEEDFDNYFLKGFWGINQ